MNDDNYMALVTQTLSAEAFWSVNKAVARKIGIEETAFLAEIIFKHTYWKNREGLDDQGGFFLKSDDIQNVMGIGIKPVARLTKSIQKSGLVKVKKRGVPAKNYWYPQWSKIYAILTSEPQTGLTGKPQTDSTGHTQKGVAITKNINKENNTENAIAMLPSPFEQNKEKNKSKTNKDKEKINQYPEIEALLRIISDNGFTKTSDNTKRLMKNAVLSFGEAFCCEAVHGRFVQLKKTGKTDPMFPTFFDPDRSEWMETCSKMFLAEGHRPNGDTYKSSWTPEEDREMDELMSRAV